MQLPQRKLRCHKQSDFDRATALIGVGTTAITRNLTANLITTTAVAFTFQQG